MFIDASVIVAIMLGEADAPAFEERLGSARTRLCISPLVRYEASVALARAKSGLSRKATPQILAQARQIVDEFISALDIKEIAIGPDTGRIALDAAERYGKTVGHKADLNLGDCFSYACAKGYRLELLYKGNDFVHTDLG